MPSNCGNVWNSPTAIAEVTHLDRRAAPRGMTTLSGCVNVWNNHPAIGGAICPSCRAILSQAMKIGGLREIVNRDCQGSCRAMCLALLGATPRGET